MSDLFDIEWMGGVAEYHYRKARPTVGDFDWQSLDPSRYEPSLVFATQKVWTDVTMSEYAAISAFSAVVGALTEVRAPLDLIGMTSDFVTDEVRHVELLSQLVMQLGGAAPRPFDPSRLAPRVGPALSAFQRANELALRVGCIAEAFAGATATPMMRATRHPLVRAVYTSILRDEARHRRFGTLYFEWAADRLDDAERTRLGRVALAELRAYAPLWTKPPSPVTNDRTVEGWHVDDIHDLGWLESIRYVTLAKSVVKNEIVPNLRTLGLVVDEQELQAVLS